MHRDAHSRRAAPPRSAGAPAAATAALLLALAAVSCGGDGDAPAPHAPDPASGIGAGPGAAIEGAPEAADPARAEAADRASLPGDGAGAEPTDGGPPDAAPEAPTAPDGWVLYRHARGTSMYHPPDWSVRETPAGLVVVPPDHDPDREIIVGTASDAGGLTDPTGLRARRRIDRTVAETMPGLEREGRGRRVATRDGAGAAYDYAGRAPDGTRVRARVFATIADGAIGGLSILADEERFGERVDVVETMFTTIHRAEGDAGGASAGGGEGADPGGDLAADLDPRLVGAFRGEAIASGGGTYVNTQLLYALNADGTLLYGAQSHMNASQRDASGNLRWTADGSTDGRVQTGRWTAEGGVLTIRWDRGGRSVFAYGFEPDGTLALRDPVTRRLINIYSRVR